MRLLRLIVALLGLLVAAGGIYNILSAFSNPPWSVINTVIGMVAGIFGLYIFFRFMALTLRPAGLADGETNVLDHVAFSRLMLDLDRMGFYKYTDSWMVDKLRAAALLNGDLFYPLNRRTFLAKADTLRPGSVDEFISMISPYLKMMKVSINNFSETYDEAGNYAFKVNGHSYTVHTSDEVGKISEQVYGALVAKRSAAMLNRLFETAKAEERAYLRKVDDYYQFIFITPKMYNLIQESAALADANKPQAIEEGND